MSIEVIKRSVARALFILLALGVFASTASAASIPMGYFSWNVTEPRVSGEFDVVNQTGANSTSIFPDMTWPVTNQVLFGSLSLDVDFTDGSSQTYNMGTFSSNVDGISWDGQPIDISGNNPLPTFAKLSLVFDTTSLTLNDGSTPTIFPTYTDSIALNLAGLDDGALQIIYATPTATDVPVPEPGTMILLGSGIAGLMARRRRRQAGDLA